MEAGHNSWKKSKGRVSSTQQWGCGHIRGCFWLANGLPLRSLTLMGKTVSCVLKPGWRAQQQVTLLTPGRRGAVLPELLKDTQPAYQWLFLYHRYTRASSESGCAGPAHGQTERSSCYWIGRADPFPLHRVLTRDPSGKRAPFRRSHPASRTTHRAPVGIETQRHWSDLATGCSTPLLSGRLLSLSS